MPDLKDIQKVYFIGIGGIGMSALARYFFFHGKSVSGYDKTETPLTRQLLSEGIQVHYEDNLELAPKDADIVVYTPAIPSNHSELNYYRQNNYTILKRSDVLGIITNGSFNICVAGTHGKTTISSMIAHILRHSSYGCNAFLGGIAVNYNSNFWSHERNVCVVEADEYDRSFLKLHPDLAVISAMDVDHLDIYGTEEAMQDAFVEFAGKLKKEGVLYSKLGLSRAASFNPPNHLTYSLQDSSADVYAANINMLYGSYEFDAIISGSRLATIRLNMGGMHNVENIVVAIAIACRLGIDDNKIRSAVSEFKGVKRRFEYIIKEVEENGNNKKLVFIDDYAHHPAELHALISGAKSLFPGMKCTIIFQPHLFTRTRDLAGEFAESLDLADEVFILPIYPARELPIEGVSSKLIFEQMKNPGKRLVEKKEIIDIIQNEFVDGNKQAGQVLITAGAGDIDTLVLPIKEILRQKNLN